MKQIILAGIFTLLNTTINWLPSIDLTIVMIAAMTVDFITGIVKATVLKVKRTSEGYRKTVVKFMQYGGAVAVSVLLSYLANKNPDLVQAKIIMTYIGDGLLAFIIFIEVTSILENVYAVDRNTPFSKYFIQPLLKLLTFQIKNNPLNKNENESDTKR